MWNYTEKVVDHFLHPRNVGEIEDADGTGEVGSLACGDMLRLTFKLGGDGRISDAKFKTFGCASAIASSSALTEMLKGKTLDEALAITNRDIAEYLGGLPEEKMHCSVMGREALEAAIDDYRGVGKKSREISGEVVCKCFGVTDDEIRRVSSENNLTTVEQITNYTKAGGACGTCKEKIQAILDDMEKNRQATKTTSDVQPLTNIQKIHLIEEIIENRILPALRQDEGGLELIDIKGDMVFVRLKGACEHCPSAGITLRQFVEKELKKGVSPDIKVKSV
jgi:NifU-like protein